MRHFFLAPVIRALGLACVVSLATVSTASAWQQQATRVSVAVLAAETSDGSTELAARLTDALRSTVGASGQFELYDTVVTNKSAVPRGGRPAVRLPTRYICTARISRAQPGWAQATITVSDDPFKEPVVRLGSPVLIRDTTAFHQLAMLVWERLSKQEQKRLGGARDER